jgi:hypothetical protein
MTGSRRRTSATLIAAALITAVMALTGDISRAANDPLGLEPDDDGIGRPSALVPGSDNDALQPAATEPALRGNPLWGITLESLSATRDRPLFSPSRRPPATAIAPVTPLKATEPIEPEKPPLDLIGIVNGGDEGYAVFVNTATHAVISLRTGEGHDGWVLLTAKGREAVLERQNRTVVVSFPKPIQNKQ